MENRENLVEIKKDKTGTGLLIESDGYISPELGNNKTIMESYNKLNEDGSNGEFHCPHPFIVDAVFQKAGVKNANGRIYPRDILEKEIDKFKVKIQEKRALGECYRPEAMILTETGWKHLYEVTEGENILTLNTTTNEIEVKPILNVVKYHKTGKMINIKGNSINDIVTPDHGYPVYDRKHRFKKFVTAKEISRSLVDEHWYIPKTGNWIGCNDEYMIIPKINEEDLSHNLRKELRERYTQDLVIPMDIFAKFMGIYLSEGSCSKKEKYDYRVNIHQKKQDICEEIEQMLEDWGINYSVSIRKDNTHTYTISDPRLRKYVSQFGLCYDKYVPFELKRQSKETLRIFYDWFVMGDGRVRGDKRPGSRSKNLSDDVFSTSKQLVLDLNEIQLKIGYCGNLLEEKRDNNRLIEGRLIKGENTHPMFFTYRSLTKGIYLSRYLKTEEIDYDGDVMCVEVENHVWFVMDNGRCHWTKNCNHPADSVVDLSRASINIIELHWVDNTVVGKLEILTSYGFRKYGIISCEGDRIANLILQGCKIGVSSRGLGTVKQQFGTLVVADDFELVTWDVVADPSTPEAWIFPKGEIPSNVIEGKQTEKPKLIEKLDKFNDWLIN